MNLPLKENGIAEVIGQIVNLRSSALPLAFACPGSIRSTELGINPSNELAGAGSASHKLFEHLPVDGTIEWDRVNEFADEFGADDEEVRMLCAKGLKMWRKISQHFPRALTEIAVEHLVLEVAGLRITGHIDLIAISGDVARIGDWKCGRLDSAYVEQLRSYGAMVLLNFPQLREVTVTALWVRSEEVENYTMTQADAQAWLERLVSTVVKWDGVYRPSTKNCQYCVRNHECPAGIAQLRRDVAAIFDLELVDASTSLQSMPAEQIIELRRKAKTVATIADRINNAIREHVLGGNVVEANGLSLAIEREERRELDPLKTWVVLEKDFGFTDEDFAAVVKLGASKVEKRVKENAGKGKGAAAIRGLREKLELAGAVTLNPIEKVTERRI